LLSELITAQLDRDAADTLSGQVYDAIRQLILHAALRPGHRLPSSRQLAQDLGLGRNTVINAYLRLADEGYVESRVGAGSFVASTLPESQLHAPPVRAGAAARTLARRAPVRTSLSARGQAILDETVIWEGGGFAPCVPELSEFPFQIWQRLLNKAWRQMRLSDTRYGAPGGHPELRAAIAEHVQLARQVRCQPHQVVIVNGAQHGIDLCARLLADVGERVWMEDPGYPGARRVFHAANLELIPIRLDEEGMAPTARQWKQPPRLIYITPSHQFPTGVVMSLRRRRELLEAAARHGSWIIEDDYDGEFRFAGKPIASLQGIADAQQVIYLGTFSKVLFPGLRLGYLVLPESIAERFAQASAQLGFEGRQVTQAALAAFMREGHFAAHIRRMRMVYAQRGELLVQVWRKELGKLAAQAPLSGADTGMHMIAELPPGSDAAISAAALEQGVVAQSLSSLFYGKPNRSGLVLGYGAVHEQEIRRQGALLARLVKQELLRKQ
jgi:GntR family transcriptional regulator/MocR family aminotransferase